MLLYILDNSILVAQESRDTQQFKKKSQASLSENNSLFTLIAEAAVQQHLVKIAILQTSQPLPRTIPGTGVTVPTKGCCPSHYSVGPTV